MSDKNTFVNKIIDPNSLEGRMVQMQIDEASNSAQHAVRKMLHQMIDLVPGQMFRDIERFHKNFGIEPTQDPNHKLPADILKFRINFIFEELLEYAEAVGFCLDINNEFVPNYWDHINDQPQQTLKFNAEQAFDALIDLCYVALGTAYWHRFPFNQGWARVQEANMQKVRAQKAGDSKRGTAYDIVKPDGWKPPTLTDLLDETCPQCQGAGTYSNLEVEPDDCGACKGTGRRRRYDTETFNTKSEKE